MSSQVRAGWSVASRLGHQWVGPEHALLALLEGRPDNGARDVLRAAGVDPTRVYRQLLMNLACHPMPDAPGAPASCTPTASFRAVESRSEAFALAFGNGKVRSLDVLLAMLWSSDGDTTILLERLGVPRQAVVEIMKERGIHYPNAALPTLRRNYAQRVEFPRRACKAVVVLLQQRHPAGAGPRWGFNDDGADIAWVVAEEGIDLQSIVEEALASEGSGQSASEVPRGR